MIEKEEIPSNWGEDIYILPLLILITSSSKKGGFVSNMTYLEM